MNEEKARTWGGLFVVVQKGKAQEYACLHGGDGQLEACCGK